MTCLGGLDWWNGHLIVGCSDDSHHRDELRFYPVDQNLDNKNIVATKTFSKPIVFVNIFQDYVIVFSHSRKATVLSIEVESQAHQAKPSSLSLQSLSSSALGLQPTTSPTYKVNLASIWEIDMTHAVPTPINLVSVCISRVGHELKQDQASLPRGVLANVAGSLIMFAFDFVSDDMSKGIEHMTLSPPVLLANHVEEFWISGFKPGLDRHLMDTIWMNCGESIKAWLPLVPQIHSRQTSIIDAPTHTAWPVVVQSQTSLGTEITSATQSMTMSATTPESGTPASNHGSEPLADDSEHEFQSNVQDLALSNQESQTEHSVTKRIMLSFKLNMYPLTVLTEHAVFVGASHDLFFESQKNTRPYAYIERTTQIYLHHILRQVYLTDLFVIIRRFFVLSFGSEFVLTGPRPLSIWLMLLPHYFLITAHPKGHAVAGQPNCKGLLHAPLSEACVGAYVARSLRRRSSKSFNRHSRW
jgi:hypothetical protein